MKKYKSSSDSETQKIGEDFSRGLKPGDTVLLYGDLGYGKTTFVKGVAKGLGIKTRIISPTFTIVREHKLKIQNSKGETASKKSKVLYHIDLYRIESKAQLEGVGIKEIINDKSSIKLIEWADKLDNLSKKRIDIKFEMSKEDARVIKIIDHGY